MKIIQKRFVFLAGLILVFAFGSGAWAQDVLIVANKNVSISQITSSQLRELFTGARSSFKDGSRAMPVVLKGGPVHEVFLRKHVGDSPEEFRMRWRKAVFTGQGSMLKECGSEAALLEYIISTPGAVGYVSRLVDESSVKVLAVAAEK
jgi:ABC-type phosphate transport system substrate-binding protein